MEAVEVGADQWRVDERAVVKNERRYFSERVMSGHHAVVGERIGVHELEAIGHPHFDRGDANFARER